MKGRKTMKNFRFLVLCLTLAALLVLGLVACSGGNGTETGTAAESGKASATVTETETDKATDTETETATETATETDTTGGDESTGPDFSGDEYVKISSAEELMAFNRAVNGDDYVDFDDKTVVLLNDIDLSGMEWKPLDGEIIPYITFDGQGHTIKNMTINYGAERDVAEPYIGAGFIGTVPSGADVYFKNITFEGATIVARERHVGCLVGRSLGGTCTFENVTVKDFTVDGWCDYNNTSADNDGYPIAFRVAGVMGASWGGDHTFTNVTVQNITISGFHNLAGILGYDASGLISEYSFENCKVENATMVFSYCLAASYTTEMPRKFVSVFYNGARWIDNIDECVEQGNTYSGISFYDWTSTEEVDEYGNRKVSAMTEYTPENFRSWTQEEADA